MKKLLFLLFFLPITVFTQNSWVNVVVQTDNYGGETSWEIYQGDELMAASPLYGGNSYNETIVNLPEGGYNFVINDEFGDGICCAFGEGYFGLKNICGLNTFVYDFDGPQVTVYFDLLACPPPVFGCMDTEAINFNPWANSSSECTFPPAPCDTGATNIIVLVTSDSYPVETSWDITANGEVIASGENGGNTGVTVPTYVCIGVGDTLVASVYDTYGDGLCGSCWGGVDGYFDVTTLCGDSIFFIGGEQQFDTASSGPYVVPSCIPFISQGCTDPGYVEYNINAVIDDNSCETLIQLGCVDSTMFNYDLEANTMELEPSCEYTLITTDGGADGWFGSWLGITQGDSIYGPYQMGPEDGYEEDFILSLTSNEEVSVYFFTSGNAETTAAQCGFRLEGPNGVILQSGTNPWTDPLKKFPYRYLTLPTCSNYCEPFTYGCTDESAQNYNSNSNTDDSECYYSAGCTQAGYLEYYAQGYEADYDNGSCDSLAIFGCMEDDAYNYNSEANVATECTPVILGCMNPLAFDYNINANTEDECTPFIYGCTDATSFNYDADANTDDNNCEEVILGCMNEDALNYNANANTDNESCIEVILDCTDPTAVNYNELANTPNNESCLYDAGCIGEPGDPYYLNDSCYAWIISIDAYCCEVGFDNACVELYDYCEQGWPMGTPQVNDGFSVYPNPVNDVLHIQTSLDVFTEVYSALGHLIVSRTKEKRIDLKELPSGVYQVVVNYKGRISIEKIIKL